MNLTEGQQQKFSASCIKLVLLKKKIVTGQFKKIILLAGYFEE